MQNVAQYLWTLEKTDWLDGAEFYERQLGPDASMILPFPAGLQDRLAALKGLCPAQRWQAVELHDQQLKREGALVVLTYRATAWREACGTPVKLLCASSYLEDEGSWTRISHDQQPITDSRSAATEMTPPTLRASDKLSEFDQI